MTRISTLSVIAAIFFFVVVCFSADSPPAIPAGESGPNETEVVSRPRPRFDTVTIADFYMRDGSSVSGKLLSDDKNQVVIEQLSESTITTKTFSKREIDTRTLNKRIVPEWQYYSQLAEYFAARAWDFRDDPDDFIQAIRSYEKAKQALESGGAEDARAAEIGRAIKKLQDDREVWTREVESRAKLRKLEYEAEAENRLKQLEKQVAEGNVKLSESIKYFDKTSQDIKDDYQKMEKTLGELNKDFVQQIQNLQGQIRDNRAAINEIWIRCCFRPIAPSGGGGK